MTLSHYASVPLVTAMLLLLGADALAQQVPTAGSQLQQISALPPKTTTTSPVLEVPKDSIPTTSRADVRRLKVVGLQFSGASALSEAELVKICGFVPGQRYSFVELHELAARVTSHYRSLGYFLAQTYLPSQDVTEGLVQFQVVEGQYGAIKLTNQSRMSDHVAAHVLESLKSAGAVTASDLERRLLMLSDLPGINVKSVLVPGASTGTTDLQVNVSDGRTLGGSLEADNHGNLFTGAQRAGASVFFNQPAGIGDLATLRFLTSGPDLTYGQATYQALLGGLTAGVSLADLRYRLNGEFASIQSSGSAQVRSFYLSYPMIRSRNSNLSLQWSSDEKLLSDRTEVGSLGNTSEKFARLSTTSLRGDFRDSWGPAFNDYAATWTHGSIDLRDPIARDLDLLSAHSQGDFDKLTFSAGRLQHVSADVQLYARLSGQWASKNLDASEKFSLGGAGSVRAFPSGEAAGDEGASLTLEVRSNLPQISEHISGKLQLIAFLDAGFIQLNKRTWEAETAANRRELQGAGLGLAYSGPENLMVKTYYAFKLGNEVAQSQADAPGRFWLQLSKPF
ncbi:MAG: peptide transporter [Burkholderiales bacterium PBB4]|nr:MAG: peptide transporter [Burkholderiales bacterium PBB4]